MVQFGMPRGPPAWPLDPNIFRHMARRRLLSCKPGQRAGAGCTRDVHGCVQGACGVHVGCVRQCCRGGSGIARLGVELSGSQLHHLASLYLVVPSCLLRSLRGLNGGEMAGAPGEARPGRPAQSTVRPHGAAVMCLHGGGTVSTR